MLHQGWYKSYSKHNLGIIYKHEAILSCTNDPLTIRSISIVDCNMVSVMASDAVSVTLSRM